MFQVPQQRAGNHLVLSVYWGKRDCWRSILSSFSHQRRLCLSYGMLTTLTTSTQHVQLVVKILWSRVNCRKIALLHIFKQCNQSLFSYLSVLLIYILFDSNKYFVQFKKNLKQQDMHKIFLPLSFNYLHPKQPCESSADRIVNSQKPNSRLCRVG